MSSHELYWPDSCREHPSASIVSSALASQQQTRFQYSMLTAPVPSLHHGPRTTSHPRLLSQPHRPLSFSPTRKTGSHVRASALVLHQISMGQLLSHLLGPSSEVTSLGKPHGPSPLPALHLPSSTCICPPGASAPQGRGVCLKQHLEESGLTPAE